MRREVLTWSDVDKLIDYLVPQIHGRFDSMMIVTRGGIVPGGLLAEALNITYILTASVLLLHPLHELAGAGVDFDGLAFVEVERHLDHMARLQRGRLAAATGGVTFHARVRLRHQ